MEIDSEDLYAKLAAEGKTPKTGASRAELYLALRDLIRAGHVYMEYHKEKFYFGEDIKKVQGLYPALERAEAVLKTKDPSP